MSTELDKLNRLRVNAGKPELKAWKADKTKLAVAIANLEKAGFTDVVAGADIKAKPITDDPVVAEAIKEPEKKEPESKKIKPMLARGLETEGMARQSRIAVQMQRERERKEAKEEKKTKKSEERATKKSAKQEKPVKDKKKAGKVSKSKDKNDNEVTVADIARELDIDPKVARAKLRRHEDKITKLHTKGQDRWTFPKSAKADLVKILK